MKNKAKKDPSRNVGSPTCATLPTAVPRPVRATAGAASGLLREVGLGCRAALLGLAVLALQPLAAGAHETDQCTLPLGRELADLKVALSGMVQGAIVEAVNDTNAAINRSLWRGEPTEQTARLQSADWISAQVWAQLFATFPTNEGLDIMLAGQAMRARYPGLVTVYLPEQLIYDDPVLLLDVTKLTRTLFRAATVNVDGTLFGTDKIIHFIHLGRIYHSSYLSARKRGLSEAEAVAGAVQLSAGSNPFLSENGFLGTLTTGIRSNGDLAANYAGLKFYRNLTETIRVGDKMLPPMLVRDGLYWHLAERVRNQPDFFAAFITPHWNEALNPNSYAVVTDARVRTMVRSRCPDMLARYRDEHGDRLDRAQFAQIEQDLSTYYGEDYGYQDDGKNTISIATTCFPLRATDAAGAQSEAPAKGAAPDALAPQLSVTQPAGEPAADRLGRTRLWWAARDGRNAEVERLLAEGEDPNVADVDGETPLHAAARWGHTEIVETLLVQGADPRMSAQYGMTPLHVAVEQSQLDATRVLLERGSDANARDMFGASPLHQAAAQGNQVLATLLLTYGADPWALDDGARTPPQLAARSGNQALAKLLSFYAASSATVHALRPSPDDQTRAPEPAGILRVSTDAGARRPGEPLTPTDAAAQPTGQ